MIQVEEIRNVKSKRDSKDLTCRHIIVMDETHLEFHMTLWNEEIIFKSNFWQPRNTSKTLFFVF